MAFFQCNHLQFQQKNELNRNICWRERFHFPPIWAQGRAMVFAGIQLNCFLLKLVPIIRYIATGARLRVPVLWGQIIHNFYIDISHFYTNPDYMYRLFTQSVYVLFSLRILRNVRSVPFLCIL